MTMSATKSIDPAVEASFAFLSEVLAEYGPRDFAVRAWDGTMLEPDAGCPARFTLVLQHPGALRKMFWRASHVGMGEAYIYDDYDMEGDMTAFIALLRHLQEGKRSLGKKLRLAANLLRLPSTGRPRPEGRAARLSGGMHSRERDRQAISYHYDLSNEFFALWLDSRMLYTCAYFNTPEDDLDTAQERKLDYICRKLRLRPGERLMDFGCGWGALVLYAAQNYGVEAVGVTLSQRQAEWAQQRIRQAGMESRCRVEFRDYRDVNEPHGYDKLAAVCMIEHVGEAHMPEFFGAAWRLLRPGGAFLNQSITVTAGQRVPRKLFVHSYVFPDGELRPISTILTKAEQAGFEVRDVEGLREHYALTLQHWLRGLEANHDRVVGLTDETTYRVFRTYLARSLLGYQIQAVNLYQSLLVKPDRGVSGLPLTRTDWYA
jgi:cyclopropane-fatty-acyl-phospholipid synthase